MAKRYFTLLVKEPGYPKWFPDFGDWDKETVEQESRDRRDSGDFVRGTRFRIIETDGTNAAINARVSALNGQVS